MYQTREALDQPLTNHFNTGKRTRPKIGWHFPFSKVVNKKEKIYIVHMVFVDQRQMRRGYDYGDGEFATAVAASAFAIHSLEEYQRKLREGSEISFGRVRTRKDERSLPIEAASFGRPFGQDDRTTSFARPVPFTEQKQNGNSKKYRNAETKADAWEKAEIVKIKKRYEKMQSDILAWENEKKMGAKLQHEKKKNELELRRDRNLQHFKNKLDRIDHIAGGARAQIEEKRKYEESVVKERSRKIRSTGNAPVRCFCF